MLLLIHFLRAVDAVEAYTLRALIVQDFEGVAVENGDDNASEIGGVYLIDRNDKRQAARGKD